MLSSALAALQALEIFHVNCQQLLLETTVWVVVLVTNTLLALTGRDITCSVSDSR